MEPQQTPKPVSTDGSAPQVDETSMPSGLPAATMPDAGTVPAAAPEMSAEAATEDAVDPVIAGATIKPGAMPSANTVETSESAASPVSTSTTPSDAPTTDTVPMPPALPDMPLPVSAPKSRKRLMLAGIVVAATLLVLGGGASAAYYYVVNKPENVLKRALANALDKSKTKTIAFSGSAAVTEKTSKMKLDATFTGKSDVATGAFDMSAKLDAVVTNLTFDARSVDGKTAYLRVGGLDGLAELLSASGEASIASAYAPLIGVVNNQWLELNQSVLSQVGGGSSQDLKLSDADLQKLMDAYTKNEFLKITKTLSSESIGGTDSYHYEVGVDKAKLKSFVAALKDANIKNLKITAEQLDSFNKMVDGSKIENYPVEVWIGKHSKMITQVQFKTSDSTTDVSVRLTVDSYNKPVKVDKPAGAKSILEVLGAFMGGSAGSGLTVPSLGSGISL